MTKFAAPVADLQQPGSLLAGTEFGGGRAQGGELGVVGGGDEQDRLRLLRQAAVAIQEHAFHAVRQRQRIGQRGSATQLVG
jgi:hypothetical protein